VSYAEQVTLLDLTDRLLEKGVSITGDLVISVADVDLVYVNLKALIASVETAMEIAPGTGFR
jgi:hypothetical protein